MELADLIATYDQRVPRYTSYPTAPHFSAGVDGATYAAWLRALPADTPLSLYLHVPFCAQLCWFCGCHTTAVHHPRAGGLLRPHPAGRDRPAGRDDRTAADGAPCRTGAAARRPRCRRNGCKPLRPGCANGSTCNPTPRSRWRSIRARWTTPRWPALARIGTTRASLGVQDFDPKVQRAVGRIQSFETTAECAARLRGIGIGSINLDLIYGLPYQTVSGVAATVASALAIKPDRIAVFGYAHVPWMKKQQALLAEGALPGAAARYQQRRAAEQVITGAGYDAIGLDHFARPADALAVAARTGRLRRNFQGYTTDDAPVLLGLGASSIGALPQGYVQNTPGVPGWREAIQAGRLPIARGIAPGPEDRLRGEVIERIMCDFAVDLSTLAARHGADPATLMDAAPALQAMAQDGLVQWAGYGLRVTAAGRPFVRNVAAAFDTYLRTGVGRHSAAV